MFSTHLMLSKHLAIHKLDILEAKHFEQVKMTNLFYDIGVAWLWVAIFDTSHQGNCRLRVICVHVMQQAWRHYSSLALRLSVLASHSKVVVQLNGRHNHALKPRNNHDYTKDQYKLWHFLQGWIWHSYIFPDPGKLGRAAEWWTGDCMGTVTHSTHRCWRG